MTRLTGLWALLIATLLATPAAAGVITFEDIPGVGMPSEGLVIDTQFQASEGVTFSLEGGGAPQIAEVGAPRAAFAGPPNSTGDDNPLSGQSIFGFFLTDDGMVGGLVAPPVIVEYDPPTRAASGVILDIDFDETFTIELRDGTDTVLDTIVIVAGVPGTGDGVATPWSFNRSVEDVASIRFVGTREAAGAFGLGFDNFNTRSSQLFPLPAPALRPVGLLSLISVLAIIGFAAALRRFRNRDDQALSP